jgi:hypothetical protein
MGTQGTDPLSAVGEIPKEEEECTRFRNEDF